MNRYGLHYAGIPAIESAQKHRSQNLASIATIATLFSSVSATALQFSLPNRLNTLFDIVNGFWFISLVFSIASALNSVLGLTWIQHAHRSPMWLVPPFIAFWFWTSPLVFLTISVACFDLGLVVFAYASKQVYASNHPCLLHAFMLRYFQHVVNSILVTFFTAFTGIGVMIRSVHTYLRHIVTRVTSVTYRPCPHSLSLILDHFVV